MHPTCQWLVDLSADSDEKTTCGKKAVVEVTVKTKITQAKVALCSGHKREHDVSFAQARTDRKSKSTPKVS